MHRIEKDFRQIQAMISHCNDIIRDSGKTLVLDVVTLQDEPEIQEFLKFYADTPAGEKNKMFTFRTTLPDLEKTLINFFLRGFAIRSAWYHVRRPDGTTIENTRITNLIRYQDMAWSIFKKQNSKISLEIPIFQPK